MEKMTNALERRAAKAFLGLLLAALVLACAFPPEVKLPLPKPEGKEGHAYMVYLPPHLPFVYGLFYKAGETQDLTTSNPAPNIRLYAGNQPLGPAWHRSVIVRETGDGAYSIRSETLFFSTVGNAEFQEGQITLQVRYLPRLSLYLASLAVLLLLIPGPRKLREWSLLAHKLDSQPLALGSVKINRYAVTFCAFLFLALYTLPAPTDYTLFPDTESYLSLEVRDPWKSLRSPGYPLLIQALDVATPLQHAIDSGATEGAGLRLIQVQYALLACAFALFGMSLAQLVPWYGASGMGALALYQVPLIDPRFVLTEPLAQALLLLCMACLISGLVNGVSGVSGRWRYMLLASALATYGFLVRPALVFLLPVAGLLLLWLCWRQRHALRRALLPALGSAVLLGASLLYPLQLYVQSGMPTLGTLSGISKIMFALFVADPEDIHLVKNPQAQKVLERFFADKESCDRELHGFFPDLKKSPSVPYAYTQTVNQYGWRCYGRAIDQSNVLQGLDAADKNRRYHRIAMDISDPIIAQHKPEIREIMVGSFLASFGLVADYHPTFTGRYTWGKYFFLLSIPVILLALGVAPYPLSAVPLLLCGAHVLHVAALSVGHASLERYTQLSESIYIIGVLLAVYALCTRRKGQHQW